MPACICNECGEVSSVRWRVGSQYVCEKCYDEPLTMLARALNPDRNTVSRDDCMREPEKFAPWPFPTDRRIRYHGKQNL